MEEAGWDRPNGDCGPVRHRCIVGVAARERTVRAVGSVAVRGRLDGSPPPALLLTPVTPLSPVLMVEIKLQPLATSDAQSPAGAFI